MLRPVAGAFITVCAAGNANVPCAPPLAGVLFKDQALTQPLANPTTTDANGNYPTMALAAGNYTITETAVGFTGFSYQITVTCGAGSCTASSLTVTGTSTLAATSVTTLTASGVAVFTGALTNCQLNGVLYVPGAAGCWTGSDIGAQLNTAYAACPAANTVCHIILTNSSPLNFSTTINFNTSGKYVLLESMYPCVFVTTAAGGCLNFTPTSGIALELDYVPATASGFTVAHGLKNVGLINNSCFTSGGCGGTAFAIDIGNTNHGASNATFDTVSIIGFNFGFNISNTQNLPSVFWKNPHFQDNNIAFLAGNETGNTIVGGLFIANQSNIQAETAVGGEYTLIGTGFSTNTSGPMFDFTRNTTRALFTCSGCHFEDSAAASANTPHYIQGSVDARIYGGTMETDQTSGTQDWFVNISAGGALEVHGLELSSGGKTFTQAFLLNTTARANIQTTLFTPTLFPVVAGGVGAALSTIITISANAPATFQTDNVLISGASGTYRVTADQTITAGASLTNIPGLSWTMPANTALNTAFSCHLLYSQATAAASDSFGIQDVTVAPTSLMAKGQAYLSASTFTAGNLPALTTTAATAIVTFTPSAATTVWNADIDGMIEQPSNASSSAVNIMAQFTTNNGTIKRGSYCEVW